MKLPSRGSRRMFCGTGFYCDPGGQQPDEETVPMIEAVSGVDEVNAPYRVAEAFATVQHILRIVSAAVIILLLVVSLLIISNTVKLAMYDRRDEIAIMKMVGATNAFIRFPFVVEGFLLGMFGAAMAFFLEWGLYNALVSWIGKVDALNLLQFVPFAELLWPMMGTFGAAGLFVGILAALPPFEDSWTCKARCKGDHETMKRKKTNQYCGCGYGVFSDPDPNFEPDPGDSLCCQLFRNSRGAEQPGKSGPGDSTGQKRTGSAASQQCLDTRDVVSPKKGH